MNTNHLKRLYVLSFLATAALLLCWFFSCGIQALPPAQQEQPAEPGPRAQKPEAPTTQSYTYVGAAAEPPPERKAGLPGPRETNAKVRVMRKNSVESRNGRIPDLDIALNGQPIARVMAHYGYVLAVASRSRLLGKIVGREFLPLTREELSQYAARGRSAAAYPGAKAWLRRISQELRIPQKELRLLFLVPQHVEQFFIQTERRAIAHAGKALEDVMLVRAHFDADLAVVVDQLHLESGEIVAIDSLRNRYLR